MTASIVYTLTTCPPCIDLREEWTSQGIEFDERRVDQNQAWMDEALKYGDSVPIIVYADGRVETGFAGEVG